MCWERTEVWTDADRNFCCSVRIRRRTPSRPCRRSKSLVRPADRLRSRDGRRSGSIGEDNHVMWKPLTLGSDLCCAPPGRGCVAGVSETCWTTPAKLQRALRTKCFHNQCVRRGSSAKNQNIVRAAGRWLGLDSTARGAEAAWSVDRPGTGL